MQRTIDLEFRSDDLVQVTDEGYENTFFCDEVFDYIEGGKPEPGCGDSFRFTTSSSFRGFPEFPSVLYALDPCSIVVSKTTRMEKTNYHDVTDYLYDYIVLHYGRGEKVYFTLERIKRVKKHKITLSNAEIFVDSKVNLDEKSLSKLSQRIISSTIGLVYDIGDEKLFTVTGVDLNSLSAKSEESE